MILAFLKRLEIFFVIMRKIKINPKYEYLRDFIGNIPLVFEQEGREIYHKRNLIKVLTAPDGTQINVKRYHVPHGPNRLVYSWGIRKPKGERAFEYPKTLKDKGIGTPEPVALIEDRNLLYMLGYSYLITIQCDYGHTLYEVGDAQPGEYEKIAKALAHFAANIHNRNILHKDFTPGNVLWKQDDEGFHFMLVDINRMKFGEVSIKEGLYNLRKFWGPKDFIHILVTEYALLRNTNVDEAVEYVMKERAKFWTKYGKKHEIPFRLEL